MIVLPVILYPLVALAMAQWVGVHQEAQKKRVTRAGLQGEHWAELNEAIAADATIEAVGVRNADDVSRW